MSIEQIAAVDDGGPITEVLRVAKELIADPKHWVQGYYATTADGQEVDPANPEAACFCSAGAMRKASGVSKFQELTGAAFNAEMLLRRAVGSKGIFHFNDSHTHSEVMAAFDAAIAESRSAS